jgi:CheY-like chemotaxis protein
VQGRVLVAEDTPELQLLVRRMLERMGATVSVVDNGQEAVNLATAQPFDLIFMDMQMPVMDGIEATQLLKAREHCPPIVALTANVMQKHREQFDQAGCDGFLAKPINRQGLQQVLKQYLS